MRRAAVISVSTTRSSTGRHASRPAHRRLPNGGARGLAPTGTDPQLPDVPACGRGPARTAAPVSWLTRLGAVRTVIPGSAFVVPGSRHDEAPGRSRRIVPRPRRRDGPGPGSPAAGSAASPAAPLPAGQLVERRHPRGPGGPEQRELHRLHRRGAPRSIPTSAATTARRTSIYGMIYIVVPGTQPLEIVDFVRVRRRERRRGPGASSGLSDPGRGAGRSRDGSKADSRATRTPSGDRHMLHRGPRQPASSTSSTTRAGTRPRPLGGGLRARSSRWTRNARRPEGWTSADAAGLAILPGLVRYDEAFGPGPDPPRVPRDRATAPTATSIPASHTRERDTPARCPWGRACASRRATDITRLPGRRPEDLPGHEDLRPDRGRQRQRHVHHRHLRHALGQRRAQPRLRRLHASRLRGDPARMAAPGGRLRPAAWTSSPSLPAASSTRGSRPEPRGPSARCPPPSAWSWPQAAAGSPRAPRPSP